jgi:hypothetical protein
MPKSISAVRLVALLLILPGLALAEGYATLSYGSGPDGYRSYSFTGDVDLSKSVKLSLDHFLSQSDTTEATHQTGLGASWQAAELISMNYRHSSINDGKAEVSGNEGGLSFALDTLWQSELQTTLNLGYGEYKFKAVNPKLPIVANWRLTQSRSSVGLSQEITPAFSINASHDSYKYDKDLTLSSLQAISMQPRRPRLASRATTLLSYPDKSNALGMNWAMSDVLTWDVSFAKTSTLLKQELKSTRLGAEYQASESLSLSIAATRSTSDAVLNNSGTIVLSETRDNYWELTAAWSF